MTHLARMQPLPDRNGSMPTTYLQPANAKQEIKPKRMIDLGDFKTPNSVARRSEWEDAVFHAFKLVWGTAQRKKKKKKPRAKTSGRDTVRNGLWENLGVTLTRFYNFSVLHK